jgi:acetaldehyde dehydrogenase (acetylating)
MDEYIETTEKGIQDFSGCKRAKSILILNPALPCVNMQTTVYAKAEKIDLTKIKPAIEEMVSKIQKYVPGYQLIVPPTIENDRLIMTVRVQGLGDYLPSYAGNLDIINCAAIAMAEEYSKYLLKEGR